MLGSDDLCEMLGLVDDGGTICAAVQPLPMTMTFLSSRSTSCRHSEEWKMGPEKDSAPGTPMSRGVASWPAAAKRNWQS